MRDFSLLRHLSGVWARVIFHLGLACFCLGPVFPADRSPARVQSTATMVLHNRSLELKFSRPKAGPSTGVFILYSTGDGGWRGLDNKIYDWVASSDYVAAGFSSRSYLKCLESFPEDDVTTPIRVARDFRSIVDFARSRLNLPPETRVLLIGNSRGAGLSVVAAGVRVLKRELAGVVAVALTREEEHVFHPRRGRGLRNQPARVERIEIRTYEYLSRLADIPLSVIQSEKDGYLPASEARKLFGLDTTLHTFHPIRASNHSFKGGRAELEKEIKASLQKMDKSHPENAGQLPRPGF
jgi:hypothetical protein